MNHKDVANTGDKPPINTDKPPINTDKPPINTDKPPINTDKSPINTDINTPLNRIKAYFENHDFITSKDVQNLFGLGASQSKEMLHKYVSENILQAFGENRNRKYILKDCNFYITHQEKILQYLKINPYITNKEVQQLLGLKEDWVKNILSQMVSQGTLEAIGNNKGRKYKWKGKEK